MYKYLYLALLLSITVVSRAATVKDSTELAMEELDQYVDSVRNSFHYESGLIQIAGGKATIDVPAGFKYLNAEQSKKVLVDLWNNPPDETKDVLGMLFPNDTDPFSENNYVFVIEFEELGFIKDDDAEKIDYNDMLKNIHEGEKAENDERTKLGYPTIHLVGWAQQPFYDKDKKVLHWAKELAFQGEDSVHTLNYNIRLLGRHGVLSLNAVCTMKELSLVKADISKVLNMAKFTEGNAYADFDPKIDKVAAWTIGGLVAGKVLAKVGFFAIIVKFLAAFWKFILLGFAACFAFVKKLFKRKKEEPVEGTTELAAIEEEVTEEKKDDKDESTTPPPIS